MNASYPSQQNITVEEIAVCNGHRTTLIKRVQSPLSFAFTRNLSKPFFLQHKFFTVPLLLVVMHAFICSLSTYSKVSFQGAKSLRWHRNSRVANINLHVPIKAVTLPQLNANLSKLFHVSSALVSTFAYSSHCLATEGTGEPLGVDDPRVLVVLTIIPILVFLLWLQFNGQQSNDDFLDTYDQRRR